MPETMRAIKVPGADGLASLKAMMVSEPQDRVLFYYNWCKSCEICVLLCPQKVIAMGDDNFPHLIDADGCTDCGLCEWSCPDFVIVVPHRKR